MQKLSRRESLKVGAVAALATGAIVAVGVNAAKANTGDARLNALAGELTQAEREFEQASALANDAHANLPDWVKALPFIEVARAWDIEVTVYNGKEGRGLGWYAETRQIGLGVENTSTFLHELAHAADHKNGKLTERGQHWRSETVAEFSAAILCQLAGLEYEADLGGAYRYIEKYSKAAEKPVRAACLEALDRICAAVALVLETASNLQADTATAA